MPPDPVRDPVLAEVAELHRRAAVAAAAGDLAAVDELSAQADRLRRRARPNTGAERPAVAQPSRTSTRSQALVALDDMGVPAPPREISAFHLARFGVELDVRGLASVRRDERKAYNRSGSDRPTPYLVPALDARFLQPLRGPLTLSSWPLERRLVAAASPRVDHLRLTCRLADLAERLSDPRGGAVLALAARYGQSLPDAIGDPHQADAGRIRDAARHELGTLEPQDEQERRQAAERARQQLAPDELLWGWSGQHGLHTIAGERR